MYCAQYGFGSGRNTELACLSLIDRILPAIVNKTYAICIFLDFSACFDTISRPILADKLIRYGIQDDDQRFIKSYFSGRSQCVKYKDAISATKSQDIGVIQGSQNGPLFFDIYANDFSEICDEGENIHFADDTCLIYVGHDLTQLTTRVNNKLKTVLDWCKANKLSINPSKSELMIFTNKAVLAEPEIFLGIDKINRKSSVKYLGLHIDDKMHFNNHFDSLKTKLSRFSGVSYRLGAYFNLRAAKNYYYSCVYSTLTYCVSVYGGQLHTTKGKAVSKLQSRIVHNLFLKYSQNQCPYKYMKILKLEDIYRLYAAIHMYKIVQLDINETVGDTMVLSEAPHNYNTRNRHNLRPPYPRTDTILYSYKYEFISIWNSVPDAIKIATSLKIFKRKLTELILESY